MKAINSKRELYRSSEDEIRTFFASAVFRGDFLPFNTDESKKAPWASGKVENISINGQTNDLCPKSLWIPNKFKDYVKKGLCEFRAGVDFKALKAEQPSYKLLIKGIKNIAVPRHNFQQEKLFKHNLKLKDNRFIGQFTINSDGSFAIRDIRRSDFSKLILQNGKEQQPIVFHPRVFKPKDKTYYEFTWILNDSREDYVYLFKVDESQSFIEITPKELIKRLHDDIMSYPPGAAQKIVKMLDTIKNQLTASGKEIFVYELLQNANDYPYVIKGGKEKVDVEFHLTLSSLVFMHTGAEFNEKNIAAICSINDKEKDANKDAIGYKGIGFKTVFLDNEYVYLQTGNYSFRFDRQATKDVVDTAWQILPIWTDFADLSPAERAIFSHASSDFRVKFALRPTRQETLRTIDHNYEQMFRTVFANERVILFIPNLANVRIYLQGKPTPDIICSRSNDRWRVDDFEEDVDENLTESINATIEDQENRGGLKIPTKYYDFKKTKVSFACEIEGRILKCVDDTCLYCYLPAKDAKWGLKFLMNTDMIPNGARDNIEVEFDNTINVNVEIAKIAGSKFFDWIHKLCSTKLYEYDSIFALIPDFETIEREHGRFQSLIEVFKNGFDERIKEDGLIPTENGAALVSETILDKTGFTSSGVLSDTDFLKFTNNDNKSLPILALRNSASFQSFMQTYLEFLNAEENVFDLESLHILVRNEYFKQWLMIQENNDRFLKFLLDNDYLEGFLNEDIFIEEECKKLFKAEDIYFDVDEELLDLQAFSAYIPYLSFETRHFFENDEKWEEISNSKFKEFDSKEFINKDLLADNKEDVLKILREWDASKHFFHFLAREGIVPDILDELPLFNDEDSIEEDYRDKFIFFSSKKGKEICNADWLEAISFVFISSEYDEETLKYFAENLDVRNFSDEIIVKEIILSDKYQEAINLTQQQSVELSKSFVYYCYEHQDFFDSDSLRNYALSASNKNDEFEFLLEEDIIYFPSDYYEHFSERPWIEKDWMHSLDLSYFEGFLGDEQGELKRFIHKTFNIKDITAKDYYKDVVRADKHINIIIDNTSGDRDSDGEKNVDFVKFLDDNYKLIFEEEKDEDRFKDFILISSDDCDIPFHAKYVFPYDSELKEILQEEWFPEDLVYMCSERYRKSKAILKIKAERYVFSSFFSDIIIKELSAINGCIDTKDKSIDFHNFVIRHKSQITDIQLNEMKNAKVYLYGSDIAADTSSNHHILSKAARELYDKGLVEFSDLDIIAPEYKVEDNVDYWEARLGNTKFTVQDFLKWLGTHLQTFNTTISDKEHNLMFWRWVKQNVSTTSLKMFPTLHVLLVDDTFAKTDDVIYLSDTYIPNGGIESIVKEYDEKASFISPEYVEKDDKIEDWESFWTKLGVLSDVIDILVNTVIPRLKDIDDENLPYILARYRGRLEEKFGNIKLLEVLSNLRVKAADGNFHPLSETVFVNIKGGTDEPFAFIKLPNQIYFQTGEERQLVKDIMDYDGGNIIDNETNWQEAKIKRYLEIQTDENLDDLQRSVHYQFINELAGMYERDKTSLNRFENISGILILDNNGYFINANELTLSSVYKPYCDFQKYGIASLLYVSDSYSEHCSSNLSKFFSRVFKVHHDFDETDAQHLTEREFSIYFWTKYLVAKQERGHLNRVKELLDSHVIDELACIPTKDFMKKPSDLYSRKISNYVKKTEDWENKLPLAEIPDIQYDDKYLFDYLPFMQNLSFSDCLCALFSFRGKESRQEIIRWAIQGYNDGVKDKVVEYRNNKDALWTNARNETVHITNLYALDENCSMLEQYFRGSDRIINRDFFPSDFRKACDIFQIKTIEENDLEVNPKNVHKDNELDIKHKLKVYALIIAGIANRNIWQKLYDSYLDKIGRMALYACDSISFQYKEDPEINQKLKKFFHMPNSDDFYYVDSLDDKRVFKSFVENFRVYLGINESMPMDLTEEVMSDIDTAVEIVRQYNDLMIDDAFIKHLSELLPSHKYEFKGRALDDSNDNTATGKDKEAANDVKQDDVNFVSQEEGAEKDLDTGRDKENEYKQQRNDNQAQVNQQTTEVKVGENENLQTDTETEDSQQEAEQADHGTIHGRGNLSPEDRKQVNLEACEQAYKYLNGKDDFDCSSWDYSTEGRVVKSVLFKGRKIVVVITSSNAGYIYLNPYAFAQLMQNPDNLLVNVKGDEVRTYSFKTLFEENKDVNLIFDTDVVNPETFADLANKFMTSKNTSFVVPNPNYSASEEIEGFGLHEKMDNGKVIIPSDDLIW